MPHLVFGHDGRDRCTLRRVLALGLTVAFECRSCRKISQVVVLDLVERHVCESATRVDPLTLIVARVCDADRRRDRALIDSRRHDDGRRGVRQTRRLRLPAGQEITADRRAGPRRGDAKRPHSVRHEHRHGRAVVVSAVTTVDRMGRAAALPSDIRDRMPQHAGTPGAATRGSEFQRPCGVSPGPRRSRPALCRDRHR